MKKFLVLGLCIIGIALLSQMSWDHFRHRQQIHILEALKAEPTTITAPRSMKDLMGQSLDSSPISLPPQATVTCQKYWRQMMEVTLNDWFKEISEKGWNEPAECRSIMPAPLIPWAQRAEEACSQVKSFTPECNLALLNYRTKLAGEFYRQARNYADMPLSLLLIKIYSQILMEQQENKMTANELFKMVEALVQRETKFYPARKLVLMALYTAQQQESDPDLKASYNQKLSIELDQVRTLHGGRDSEILQMEQSPQTEEIAEAEETTPPSGGGAVKLHFDILNW